MTRKDLRDRLAHGPPAPSPRSIKLGGYFHRGSQPARTGSRSQALKVRVETAHRWRLSPIRVR